MRGKTHSFIPRLRKQHQSHLIVQRKGLGFYFFYLFKYLATFGSASPACTKGTTLEQEKETFRVFNFLTLTAQMSVICWNTNLHTPTSPGCPHSNSPQHSVSTGYFPEKNLWWLHNGTVFCNLLEDASSTPLNATCQWASLNNRSSLQMINTLKDHYPFLQVNRDPSFVEGTDLFLAFYLGYSPHSSFLLTRNH